MNNEPIRVCVWSTGGIGSMAIQAITRRPDMELVGVCCVRPRRHLSREHRR